MGTPKEPDQFDTVLAASIGKNIVAYMKNGKAMTGVLRKYDTTSILIDGIANASAGTAVSRADISSLSQKESR